MNVIYVSGKMFNIGAFFSQRVAVKKVGFFLQLFRLELILIKLKLFSWYLGT